MTWQFDLASNIGGRSEQQDRTEVFAVPGRAGGHLVVLADGMGGQQEGALAAQTVIETARRQLPGLAPKDPRQFLTGLCVNAHEAIRTIGKQNESNLGSTCTALYLKGEEAYWIHVGDSRLYHFGADRLLARTSDHTVAELLNGGADADPPGLDAQRNDNRLYMCLGGENELQPEFGASAVGDNDWFMLCSDGFWNQVDADEVAGTRALPLSEQRAASELVTMAAERGGAVGDNVSLVLATPGKSPPKGVWQRLFRSNTR